MTRRIEGPEKLSPGEVARMFGVDPKTVVRWAQIGKLRSTRTLGITGAGHRRFYRAEVEALMNGTPLTPGQLDALMRGEMP